MSPPRRLLHVIDDARPIGGAQTYLHGLTAALAARGWSSGLVAGTIPPHMEHVDWIADDPARAGEFEPDTVLVHTFDDAGVVRKLARLAPTFVFEHDYRHVSPGNLRFYLRSETFCERGFGLRCLVKPYTERCNNRRPDRVGRSVGRVLAWRRLWPDLAGVLCASRFVADVLVDAGVPSPTTHVVPYFVDVPGLEPAEPEARSVLYVGRTSAVKGVHHLLRALVRIPDARLVIAGGPSTGPLEALAHELGVGERVSFPGWLAGAELERAYAGAAVVVVPSVWPEPFGIAGVEAQARGRPVVACDVGGISEWLLDGETGVLVPPADDAALAKALASLLDDAPLRERLGDAGRERARAEYSLERHLERLLPILEGVA